MIPFADSVKSRRFPWMTALLILINVIVFYLELSSEDSNLFIFRHGLVPLLVDPEQPITWLRFLTAMFLHAGFFHIIINMLFLWVFGDNIEDKFGSFTLLAIFLFGGILGNVMQYLLNPDSLVPIVGASGGVAAVLGTYLIFFPRHTIKALVPIFFLLIVVNVPAWLMLIYWFFTQFFSGLSSLAETAVDAGGVAYVAHVAGFAVGLIAALLVGWRQRLLSA